MATEKTDWNMQFMDFERIHEISRECDRYGFLTKRGEVSNADSYLAALRTLYNTLYPLMNQETKDVINNQLKDIQGNIRNITTSNDKFTKKKWLNSLIERLDILNRDLYVFKQRIGLGIIKVKNMSDKERLKRAIIK